ncbi:hypothetical protein V6N12_063051 [Hibiscus sabdariffa]|uniref:Uncharacterized protein n=1 Tax=Hibiscus sabdariffa TaxID=183260 RepID=A0ABR2FAM1_9ROSI
MILGSKATGLGWWVLAGPLNFSSFFDGSNAQRPVVSPFSYSLVKEGEWVIDDGGLMKLREWQEVEGGFVRHGLMKLDDGGV